MKHCPQCDSGYPDSHTTCPLHGVALNEILDLKPGMVVHQSYRIVRKLGQGGMGAVYLAQHILMDEPRALKFLSPELSRDQAFTGRFLREVRTLRQVRNRNVVDCGDLEAAEDGSLFFSMEYVDGPDLRGFLDDPQSHSSEDRLALKGHDFSRAEGDPHENGALAPDGALPVELALSIARGIAEGLGAAHGKGMVHRDIKPENILMAREGGAWVPKIADFGIVATKESSSVYTRTGGTLLTMAYAAPEQWRGAPAAELDGRTDLYALGGVLYEMLTGQTPFHAENYEGWARQHQTTPPPSPSTIRPDLAAWQGLDALVLRLLAKSREERPKDVAELFNLLDSMRYAPPKARRETVARSAAKSDGDYGHASYAWLSRETASEKAMGDSLKAPGPAPNTLARKLPSRAEWLTLLVSWLIMAAFLAVWFISQPSNQPKTDKGITFSVSDIRPLSSADSGVRGLPLGASMEPVKPSIQGQDLNEIEQKAELLLGQDRYAEAAPLFAQACDAGWARGCADLAYLYDHGKGVIQDYSREATLATKACNAGDAYGCDVIGELYEEGRGVTQDYSRAIEFYTKACKGRDPNGCYNIGLMYDNGQGVAKDASQAAAFYFKACNAGSADGCNQMASVVSG